MNPFSSPPRHQPERTRPSAKRQAEQIHCGANLLSDRIKHRVCLVRKK